MTGRRSPRGTLSRERILDAALQLIDAHGIEAFSMRRLGAQLGVDPMAVYHHVGAKRAIVLALVERVVAGFGVPGGAATWEQRVRAWASAYRELALAHPGLVLQIVSDPEAVAIAAVHVNEPLVAALKEAGLAPAAVAAAVNVTVDYVHGAVLPAAARPRAPQGTTSRWRRSDPSSSGAPGSGSRRSGGWPPSSARTRTPTTSRAASTSSWPGWARSSRPRTAPARSVTEQPSPVDGRAAQARVAAGWRRAPDQASRSLTRAPVRSTAPS
jgi:TetR/AcrR family transcriptional regulator, tetracycline repressor protein